jgi:hypothetical protein
MKTFQSVFIAASIIFVSASVTAATLQASTYVLEQTNTNALVMSAASSKQAAYELGLNKLSQLKTMPSKDLSQVLNINSYNINDRTLHIKDSGYVTVEERINADGKVSFVSIINVDSHYLEDAPLISN